MRQNLLFAGDSLPIVLGLHIADYNDRLFLAMGKASDGRRVIGVVCG